MTYIDKNKYQDDSEDIGYRSLRRSSNIIKNYIESESDSGVEEESDTESSSIYFKNRLNGKIIDSFPVVLKIGIKASEEFEMRNLRSRHSYDEEDEYVNGNGNGNGNGDRNGNGRVKYEEHVMGRGKRKVKVIDEEEDDDGDDGDDDVDDNGDGEQNGGKRKIEDEDVDEDFDEESEEEPKTIKSDSDYDDDAIIPRKRHPRKSVRESSVSVSTRSRRKPNPFDGDEEDEYKEFDEDDDEEDDNSNDGSQSDDSFESHRNRKLDKIFVVSDEDSDSHKRKKRRRKLAKRANTRRRVRQSSRRKVDDEDDDEDYGESDENIVIEPEEEEDLQEELRELRESATPPPEPVRKLQLRERKEVNYQILPPPLPEETFETVAVSPGKNVGRRGRGVGSVRRLFPTTGPFGGNDVISIFGGAGGGGVGGVGSLSGIPGIPGMPGTSHDQTAIIDSDSSDDDLIANSNSTNKKNSATGVSQFGIIKPKKAGNSDSDPLGVDMNIDFSSVGGLDNYINQLKEMVTLPLRYPEIYQRFGVTPPRGVLFHGPPGTGKTLMARALAASCSSEGKKITFFMRKGADCLSKWVGEAERQLRLLFEEARNQQPSIIFFDEIDGLAPVRSSKQEQIHASIVSTLLALMDGMDNRGQVIVIGATNRPDSVDPALRRPGRFDREFYFPLPDLEARKKIISIHTSKWDPPLKVDFINHIGELTKGYGGADLRALCTEAALNAIQRRYPQIYMSNEKLILDPKSINVTPADFMKSVDKIVPSSARSTSSGAAPLPTRIEPLLQDSLKTIIQKLDHLLPRTKKLTALEDALYENPEEQDGGFARQEALKNFQTARVFRPRLLICGEVGMGQQYIGSAILHHLEGFHVQSFDLGTLFSDSTRTPEATLIQLFVEARRHTPSVIYLPNVETWFDTISEQARSTFRSILRNINPTESVLVLGLSDIPYNELNPYLKDLFGYSSEGYEELLPISSESNLIEFFKILRYYISSKPTDYPEPDKRRKRVLEKLDVAPPVPDKIPTKSELKQLEKKDMQLKNLLKFKLSGLMDLFKNRYKRFKKPPIEDIHLVHLFEPPPPELNFQPAYVKDGDKILEVATGKRYFNIDLDIIEERLWNGFYSEPKQYLKDIEMINVDAISSGDRERSIKASEMLANAQVVIDEICADTQFIQSCKEMHQREIAKQKRMMEMNGVVNAVATVGGVIPPVDGVVSVDEQIDPLANSLNNPDQDGDIEMEQVNGKMDVDIVQSNPSTPQPETKPNSHSATPEPMDTNAATAPAPEPLQSKTEPTPTPTPEPPEPQPEPEERDIILDNELLAKFESKLITECISRNLVIEQLEHINTCLVDTIWKHKEEWNRNIIVEELYKSLDEVLKAISASY